MNIATLTSMGEDQLLSSPLDDSLTEDAGITPVKTRRSSRRRSSILQRTPSLTDTPIPVLTPPAPSPRSRAPQKTPRQGRGLPKFQSRSPTIKGSAITKTRTKPVKKNARVEHILAEDLKTRKTQDANDDEDDDEHDHETQADTEDNEKRPSTSLSKDSNPFMEDKSEEAAQPAVESPSETTATQEDLSMEDPPDLEEKEEPKP